MSWGNIYNVAVTSAFDGDALPAVKSAIQAAYFDDDTHYPMIGVCEMRAVDTFTVTFNKKNTLTAVKMPSGEYGITYAGGTAQLLRSRQDKRNNQDKANK